MKNYFKLLFVFILTFVGASTAFAAISDTFTAIQTQAYTAEVKASATLEFTGGATDGSHITIGDCVIHFDSGFLGDDTNCDDNLAVNQSSFATPAGLNTFFDSLTNVTDTHNGHGALSVVDVDGTHTQFITAGTETADGHLYISGANGNLAMSTRTAGVVKKPQIITFTPTSGSISPEGGVRFGAHVGNAWHFYTTSVANHTVKDIVEALQPGLNGEANFTCTEDDIRIECTATNDQTNNFSGTTTDVEPPSVSSNISVHVNENTIGTAVDIPNEVTITDADPVIQYNIHSTYKDHASLTVDHAGKLSFVNRPDYENPASVSGNNIYKIIVMVEDSAGNGHAVYVTIHIDDVDEVPVIGNANIGSRDEDLAVGSVLYDVYDFYTHTDNDGDGNAITYAIVGGNTGNVFAIDPVTGIVTLAAPLNYETINYYHVLISGTSTTPPNGPLTGNGGFWLTVNDVNEAPVIISDGSGDEAYVNVTENQTLVTTVIATDEDAGDVLRYYIIAGVDRDLFRVDPVSGELTFITAPDFENPTDSSIPEDGVYDVQVAVNDNTGSIDVQMLHITVIDENEAPVITSPSTVSVTENQTAVMTVTAIDEDVGQTLTYSLRSNPGAPDSNKFTIDAHVGTLSFITAPDFENPTDQVGAGIIAGDNIYKLAVTVTDGDITRTQYITVTVIDVLESNGGYVESRFGSNNDSDEETEVSHSTGTVQTGSTTSGEVSENIDGSNDEIMLTCGTMAIPDVSNMVILDEFADAMNHVVMNIDTAMTTFSLMDDDVRHEKIESIVCKIEDFKLTNDTYSDVSTLIGYFLQYLEDRLLSVW